MASQGREEREQQSQGMDWRASGAHIRVHSGRLLYKLLGKNVRVALLGHGSTLVLPPSDKGSEPHDINTVSGPHCCARHLDNTVIMDWEDKPKRQLPHP